MLRGRGFEHRHAYELPAFRGDTFGASLVEMSVTWLLQMFPLWLETLQDPAKALCPWSRAVPTLTIFKVLEVGLGPSISGLLKTRVLSTATVDGVGSLLC